ncbi:MAG: hypothetical protein AAF602_31615 [Myxococcota bacterium]
MNERVTDRLACLALTPARRAQVLDRIAAATTDAEADLRPLLDEAIASHEAVFDG